MRETKTSVKNDEKSSKSRAENTITAISRSELCLCLQHNVSIGMTWFGYVDRNRISLFKCGVGTTEFCGTQLKYDLRKDRKVASARAVLSQDLLK